MQKRNVAVLVDGAFYLKRHAFYYKQDDVEKVAKNLVDHCLRHIREKEERLYRIFFYDCPPVTKQVRHPLTGKFLNLSKTDTARFRMDLHERLKRTRNLAIRLGVLDEKNARWKIKSPDTEKALIAGTVTGKLPELQESDIVYYAQQKSVDMNLGLDIASLAYKQLVDKIVLVSGDSDFVPAAKLARREGIEFILDPMRTVIKPDLHEHIDGLSTSLPAQPSRRG